MRFSSLIFLKIVIMGILAFTQVSAMSDSAAFFDTIDKDKNGIITKVEVGNSTNKNLLQYFDKIDLNKDGEIERLEFIRAMDNFHSDTNKDS